jgi:hypothetical protein
MAISKPSTLLSGLMKTVNFKPPVGNKNLYIPSGDYIVMVVP